MLKASILNGVEDDSIMVFMTDDSEALFRIITRLRASRDKEIRGVAKALEIEWFRREHEKQQGK